MDHNYIVVSWGESKVSLEHFDTLQEAEQACVTYRRQIEMHYPYLKQYAERMCRIIFGTAI